MTAATSRPRPQVGDRVRISTPLWQERKGQTGTVTEAGGDRGIITLRLDNGVVTRCGSRDVTVIEEVAR